MPTCSWMEVCTMFIGYSLQATLEQINRKGLLQGRIEDVRVYSGQGMRRTCTLPPRCPHRSLPLFRREGTFLISLPFFSETRAAAPPVEAVLQRSAQPPRSGIRSSLDSELAILWRVSQERVSSATRQEMLAASCESHLDRSNGVGHGGGGGGAIRTR